MAQLIRIDSQRHGGGQALRVALVLSAATGQGFEVVGFRDRRLRPGLRSSHLAVVRAVGLACGARVHGAFEGAREMRFEPGQVVPGDFEFELAGEGSGTFVLQSLVSVLARSTTGSRLTVRGGTHLPQSPSFHFLARHWLSLVEPAGVSARATLARASFAARGEGEMRTEIRAAQAAQPLLLDGRGALVELRGVCGASGAGSDVACRMRDVAQGHFWEQRRLDSCWDVVDLPASSPGSFAQIELVFERGRAALNLLGERSVRPEVAAERLARRVLRFLDGEATVDRLVADQLLVPMALSGAGGRLATDAVTDHLLGVAAVLELFGFEVRAWGIKGGPGGVEVGRS